MIAEVTVRHETALQHPDKGIRVVPAGTTLKVVSIDAGWLWVEYEGSTDWGLRPHKDDEVTQLYGVKGQKLL